MKIAFVTDLHLRDREIDVQRGILANVAAEMDAFEPDLILVGGDLTGTQVPHRASPAERNALMDFLANRGKSAPTIVVRGNHDARGDHDCLNYIENVTYVTQPEVIVKAGIAVICWPWLDRGSFDRDANYGDAVSQTYEDLLEQQRGKIEAAPGGAVVLGHAACQGAEIRLGQPMTLTSDPVICPTAIVRTVWPDMGPVEAGFFGHYHESQQFDQEPFYYGGSLTTSEYGESLRRGWLSYETHEGSCLFEQPQPGRWLIAVDLVTRTIVDVEPKDGEDSVYVSALAGLSVDFLRDFRPQGSMRLYANTTPHSAQSDRAIASAIVESWKTAMPGRKIEYFVEVVGQREIRKGAREVSSAETLQDKLTEFWRVTGRSFPLHIEQMARDHAHQIERMVEAAEIVSMSE